MNNKLRFFGIFFASLVVILSLLFVLAATATDIIFEQNASAGFDEGVLSINWTNDTTSVAIISNWTVSFWMFGEVITITDNANTSGSNFSYGYNFFNVTEGSYNFSFSAFLENGTRTSNSSNVTMIIDTTTPTVVDLAGYTNNTILKNTETFTLNATVIDAVAGGSACTVGLQFSNGTDAALNQTITTTSNGTICNSTTLVLTGLLDGNYSITVHANDTANNFAINHTFFWVEVDTTAPTATATCSPTSVQTGAAFPCSCAGSTGTNSSLTNTSSTSPEGTGTPSSTGTFTYTCSVADNGGNKASNEATYTVEQSPASVGGSSTTTTTWRTHTISEEIFEKGYTSEIKPNNRVRMKIGGEDHHVGVKSISDGKVTIEIASEHVEVVLAVGEDARVDVTDDGFYDIYVLLNAITDNKADITISKIHEEIPADQGGSVVETTGEILGEEADDNTDQEVEGGSSSFVWIIIAIILVAAIIGGGVAYKKKQ